MPRVAKSHRLLWMLGEICPQKYVKDDWGLPEGDKVWPNPDVTQPSSWTDPQPDPWFLSFPSTTWEPEPEPAKTEEQLLKEQVDKSLEGWPWVKQPERFDEQLVTAPFFFRDMMNLGSLEVADQKDSLLIMKLLRHPDIGPLIMKLLHRDHATAWKFGATCQEVSSHMIGQAYVWDMTGGYFGGWDIMDDPALPQVLRIMTPTTIIAPVRKPEGRISYVQQTLNLRRMSMALLYSAANIRQLKFHHVPMLTYNLLALIIPQLTNLEHVGIYNCQLIPITETIRLLKLLQVDRVKERENQVDLDFYPNFHQGPVFKTGSAYTHGSFGPTWDNWNGDTCLSIWSLVSRIIPQARAQGIDMESPTKMFRQWLEKSPCHKVGEALAAMFNPETPKKTIACLVDYRHTSGNSIYHKTRQDYPKDFVWCTRDVNCIDCKTTQMGIFFSFGEVREDEYQRPRGYIPKAVCMGCHLEDAIYAEVDHYKSLKRIINKKWLCRQEEGVDVWNTEDLHKAIFIDFIANGNKVLKLCRKMDQLREKDINERDIDHELEELQRPLNKQELGGRRGAFLRSPMAMGGLSLVPTFDRYSGHDKCY